MRSHRLTGVSLVLATCAGLLVACSSDDTRPDTSGSQASAGSSDAASGTGVGGGAGGAGGAGVGGGGTSGTGVGGGTGGTGGAGVGGGGGEGGEGGAGGGIAACVDGQLACGEEGVERCDAGTWKLQTPCPQGCDAGTCAAVPVACNPGERRCYASSIKECNAAGTAWTHAEVCLDSCSDGQCAGACSPGAYRCNGGTREVCDPGGATWSASEACALGCEHTVCVKQELANQGNVIDVEGIHVYKDCVALTLGGQLKVPAGKKAEIWARCLTMAPATSATLGVGASLVVHASETIDLQGTISGGQLVSLSAWDSLTNAGSLQSNYAVLRANKLTNTATGDTGPNTVALYGTQWTNAGAHTGPVSVMPPELLSSVSHPEGGFWNITEDGLDISWERPFPGVLGYYVATGDEVPSPANAAFVKEEKITIPASKLRDGLNRVLVVGVNADGVVGTIAEDIEVTLNVKPPVVASTSHPKEGTWKDVDDVFLSWANPQGTPASSITGYIYAWDHQADTVPGVGKGLLTSDKQMLLVDQAPGIWFFHIVSVDRLGRTSPLVAHYEVRIGSEPAKGNFAGTITAQNGGAPIAGATVLLNGGLFRTASLKTGDYTFAGQVPVVTEPYKVKVIAPGYAPVEEDTAVMAGNTMVKNFALVADASVKAYRLGWELKINDKSASNAALAVGPRGKLIWSTLGTSAGGEFVSVVRGTGESLVNATTNVEYYDWGAPTEVGWNGKSFFALDYYKCDDNGSYLPGHGWSCVQMKTWDANGQAENGWVPYANSGHSGAPAGAWNGSTYGTFFVSYTSIYFRELTEALAFANAGGPNANTLLAGGYPDLRQGGRTRAIWDGSNYAILYQMENVYFARYSTALAGVTPPILLDPSGSQTQLGLAFDGSRYHVAYMWKNSNTNKISLVLRAITPAGQVSNRVVVQGDLPYAAEPSLAYDQRKLLVAYSKDNLGFVEVRSAEDQSLEQTIELGPAQNPRIAFSKETGEAYLLYARPGDGGTFLRQIFPDPR